MVVDADFDEGAPKEEAEQDASLSLADTALSQLDCDLDAGDATLTQTDAELARDDMAAGPSSEAAAAGGKLCSVCGEKADAKWLICGCGARCHIECMAKRFLQARQQPPAYVYLFMGNLVPWSTCQRKAALTYAL